MVENTILVNQRHQIHYIKFGTKRHYLIALHGFGNSASIFKCLEQSLTLQFTVLAIELPFHGKTNWQADRYDKQDMIAIMLEIIKTEQIHRFSLMGYSLGAKIAMVLFPHFQAQLDTLFLIAPDGLSSKWYYQNLLFPRWFRQATARFLNPPQQALALLEVVYKYKLMSTFAYQFLRYQLRNKEKTQRMLGTWVSLTAFTPSAKALKKVVISSNVPTLLICGALDPVVDVRVCLRFAQKANNVTVICLPTHHFLLQADLNEPLMAFLQKLPIATS